MWYPAPGKELALPTKFKWKQKKVFVFLIQWDTCMRQVCSMYHLHELNISIKFATLNALELDTFFSRERSTVLSSLRVLCSLRCLSCKLRYLCLWSYSLSCEWLCWLSLCKEKNASKQLILIYPSTSDKSLVFADSSAVVLLNHCYILSLLISNFIFRPPILKSVLLYSAGSGATVGLNIYCFYSVPWGGKRVGDFFLLLLTHTYPHI